MPTRADIEASTPRCDRGSSAGLPPCCRPMHWVSLITEPTFGKWICPAHGPMMTGDEAAERAGFRAYRIVEAA